MCGCCVCVCVWVLFAATSVGGNGLGGLVCCILHLKRFFSTNPQSSFERVPPATTAATAATQQHGGHRVTPPTTTSTTNFRFFPVSPTPPCVTHSAFPPTESPPPQQPPPPPSPHSPPSPVQFCKADLISSTVCQGDANNICKHAAMRSIQPCMPHSCVYRSQR